MGLPRRFTEHASVAKLERESFSGFECDASQPHRTFSMNLPFAMQTLARFLFTVCLTLALGGMSSFADQAPPLGPGFEPIFDGQTLEGWHAMPHKNPIEFAAMDDAAQKEQLEQWWSEASEHWSVEDGTIVNDGEGPFLVSDEEFEDYELYLEYKTVPLADSGIYLKGTPQVQIWDVQNTSQFRHKNYVGSGGLWNNSPGAKGKDPLMMADRPIGQWNTVLVRQVGARTTVILNGRTVVDHARMENYWDRDSPLFRSGPIALQTHGGEIRWRRLAVRRLSPEQANDYLDLHEKVAFRSLFDGESLQGWTGSVDDYEVVDGAIQCRAGQGGNLLTEEVFSDFQIRLEFKLPPAGNNGLAIRSPGKGDPAYQSMCELQVLDTEHPKYAGIDPRQAHGSAYGMVAAKRGFLRNTGDWNFQEVTVEGSKVQVELNGYRILDADLAEVTEFMNDRPHPGKDRREGHFGFAGHNDPVAFRNIQVRILPSAKLD